MSNYLFIDASYFIFYRYYAIANWWKLSHKNVPLGDVSNNEEFKNKFIKTFETKLTEIKNKLNIEDPKIYIGRDCKRKNIWRKKLFPDYKDHRVIKDGNNVKQIFKMVYDDNLFKTENIVDILYHCNLEADDCIALSTKFIQNKNDSSKIWIITSDMDYLQLANENTHLYNLKYKALTDSKNCFKNPEKDLFYKIIMGDKSDGINKVFNRCGLKQFEKYYESRFEENGLFQQDLNKNSTFLEKYNLNKKLIDFNNIPDVLVNIFMKKYKNII
jgi:5'-3' exonuclease